jgi:hypothetical protein
MSQTYAEQFNSALRCQTKEDAQAWLNREVTRYKTQFGMESEESLRVIHANLGYMAGYYDHATAEKIRNLFSAKHPIFGQDYHRKPEEIFEIGRKRGAKP